MLSQALRAEGLSLPPLSEDPAGQNPAWSALLRWSGNRSTTELLVDIGLGKKIATIVAKRMAKLLLEQGERPDAVTLSLGRYGHDDNTPTQGLVVIDGTEAASISMAPCCRPVPGDAIVGYFGRGEGLIVHMSDCLAGKRLYERDPERWMQVEWAEQPTRPFEAAVLVLVSNGKGVLAQVAQAVSAAEADITHIAMGDEAVGETVEIRILVSVRDRLHLADVLRTLKRSPSVLRTQRVRAK
jgi:GTP pyrophosphokinase/guanosine-3',5'-bis(diphosphate) 3'-pyrophosphohydrolase